jgi:putative photosynthetic complex assembly protein
MTNASHEILRERDREMVPKPLLRMMLALVIASLTLTSWAVWMGVPPTGQPKASPVTQERQLVIRTGGAKAVTLYDASGAFLAHLDHGGFVTVVGSGLDRARTIHHVGQDVPVTLARHQNGRLTLTDPATGWSVELTAFGSDNEAAFQALLPSQ